MNQHLKQAIAAARAGKKPQAKVLLARVIKEEPDNVNAWFLLSTLADTDEQKIQHLQKVLELEPAHPVAAEQLSELVPWEPAEPFFEEPATEMMAEVESEEATNIFPLPDIDYPIPDVPEDPDEAMAWLERLAADQGASLDELPSLSARPAETADTDTDFEDDFSWLDEEPSEGMEEPDMMAGLEEEWEQAMAPEAALEAAPEEEPARTLKISKDLDFVAQSEGDSIPAWLAGDEALLAADTIIAETPVKEAEPVEPENLPDWLHDESLEDWVGDEREKSGQVVWKAGEGDESLKPAPPGAKKAEPAKPKTAVRKTAAPKDNTNLYLALLGLFVVILIIAILYILAFQPLS
jgi:hypothetical protein